jgi:arsenate reductase (thioredoxin)
MTAVKTILVLCTGNSARSIMAEAYLNHIGDGRWRAVSAGSQPTGRVNPFAVSTLLEAGIPMPRDVSSKGWDVFAGRNAEPIDVVVTVCDNAANETCPYFPGPAQRRHLPFPDPAAVMGADEDKRAAFRSVFAAMRPVLDAMIAEL